MARPAYIRRSRYSDPDRGEVRPDGFGLQKPARGRIRTDKEQGHLQADWGGADVFGQGPLACKPRNQADPVGFLFNRGFHPAEYGIGHPTKRRAPDARIGARLSGKLHNEVRREGAGS